LAFSRGTQGINLGGVEHCSVYSVEEEIIAGLFSEGFMVPLFLFFKSLIDTTKERSNSLLVKRRSTMESISD